MQFGNEINLRMQVEMGDITKMKTDAIVNSANKSLLVGGGVDGKIHREGGKKITDEINEIRLKQQGCNTGEAVITRGGNLPANFVIHTVGPIWTGGGRDEEELLKRCYENCLNLATENNISNIAFPNISTGIYGFPKDKAAKIAVNTVKEFLNKNQFIKNVIFVCYDKENYLLYKNMLNL